MIETIAKTEMSNEDDDEMMMTIVMTLDDAASLEMKESQLIWVVAIQENADIGTVTFVIFHRQEETARPSFRPLISADVIQRNGTTREMSGQEMRDQETNDHEMSDPESHGTNESVTVIQIDENETELGDIALKHPSLQLQPPPQ